MLCNVSTAIGVGRISEEKTKRMKKKKEGGFQQLITKYCFTINGYTRSLLSNGSYSIY